MTTPENESDAEIMCRLSRCKNGEEVDINLWKLHEVIKKRDVGNIRAVLVSLMLIYSDLWQPEFASTLVHLVFTYDCFHLLLDCVPRSTWQHLGLVEMVEDGKRLRFSLLPLGSSLLRKKMGEYHPDSTDILTAPSMKSAGQDYIDFLRQAFSLLLRGWAADLRFFPVPAPGWMNPGMDAMPENPLSVSIFEENIAPPLIRKSELFSDQSVVIRTRKLAEGLRPGPSAMGRELHSQEIRLQHYLRGKGPQSCSSKVNRAPAEVRYPGACMIKNPKKTLRYLSIDYEKTTSASPLAELSDMERNCAMSLKDLRIPEDLPLCARMVYDECRKKKLHPNNNQRLLLGGLVKGCKDQEQLTSFLAAFDFDGAGNAKSHVSGWVKVQYAYGCDKVRKELKLCPFTTHEQRCQGCFKTNMIGSQSPNVFLRMHHMSCYQTEETM